MDARALIAICRRADRPKLTKDKLTGRPIEIIQWVARGFAARESCALSLASRWDSKGGKA